jgi:hypothetical protein
MEKGLLTVANLLYKVELKIFSHLTGGFAVTYLIARVHSQKERSQKNP